MTESIVVLVTAPPDGPATQLARQLVEERLAACVNLVGPIRSIYRWDGAVCDDAEQLLVIKTRRALFERLAARVVELHPYDVPEVIALPIDAGLPAYLGWIGAQLETPA